MSETTITTGRTAQTAPVTKTKTRAVQQQKTKPIPNDSVEISTREKVDKRKKTKDILTNSALVMTAVATALGGKYGALKKLAPISAAITALLAVYDPAFDIISDVGDVATDIAADIKEKFASKKAPENSVEDEQAGVEEQVETYEQEVA